ncbi:hemerythrin domain-containing protein [Schinkia azotoformans]|uniref:Hemerythrin HHE cation binding domain-containing protein n=1 Tax=Schinkia azotoformans LMG 9581 TaxID=1131731 RepID=K6CSH2_SCHAZ|nr:hemerythrin domain-containing protein [Schinkia azotoformans]EKN63192.1 hemerythrin HHE cation binding domain-containing protein [Schinkia azotoformans LMG 9581]MEC1637257.1 hemerythrin domain-containing protein [Schinkia azotoformans]MEC1720705.1 hemerythrin domain-containing protein [Schinkia azotoformans]MEC1943661.1 hemerythrin domain-containing protein [Schinkia azotoformans]MED4352347.1 hemerythrin domain-containing protein [Schinkia azotoformans]
MSEVKGSNLCEPLDQLKGTHGLLLGQMRKISQLVRELQQSSFDNEWDGKWFELYQHVVMFFAHLKIHLYKEEHFLFPIIEQYYDDDDNVLLVMDHEHKTVEQKIVQFMETFEKRKTPFSPIEALSLLSCIEFAYTTLIDHFHKEEKVLFPFAERHLVECEKEKLSSKMNIFK